MIIFINENQKAINKSISFSDGFSEPSIKEYIKRQTFIVNIDKLLIKCGCFFIVLRTINKIGTFIDGIENHQQNSHFY